MPELPDVLQPRLRRDITLLLVGTLFGAAVGAGLGIILADDDAQVATNAQNEQGDGDATQATQPAIDPTDTPFGQLSDEPGAASGVGVKVQWRAEIIEGPETGVVEFVAAHRSGTTVLISGDTRVMDDGTTIRVCNGSCETTDAGGAREALPELVRPYWDIIRSVEETTGAATYRITGETQLASGIFQRCGQFNPAEFGISVPENVVSVNQCVDAQRSVPVTIGLNGEQRSVGGAQLTAIADAEPELFQS